jgi:hypothetical protein
MNKQLLNFIDSLILLSEHDENGYHLDWNDLDDHEQGTIAAYLFNEDDQDVGYCISENNKYDDISASLVNMLKGVEHADFAEVVKKNVIKYYEKRARDLIDDRLAEMDSDYLSDRGLTRTRNRDNGDYITVRAGV